MSLITAAKETLTNLATSDVIKERLALALDQAAFFETKNMQLEKQVAVLEAQVATCRAERESQLVELEEFKKLHAEAIRISGGIEFRRGARTGGSWEAFCPICHGPIVSDVELTVLGCSNGNCAWFTNVPPSSLPSLKSALG